MNSRSVSIANFLLLAWLGLGCLAIALPEAGQQSLRNPLRDLATPGLTLAGQIWSSFPSTFATSGVAPEQSDLSVQSQDAAAAEIDRLQRELTVLRAALAQAQRSVGNAESTARLFQPTLVSARRLLPEQQTRWRTAGWLNVGHRQQLREEDWVLNADRPVLDLGKDHHLQPDQLLLAGRQIIGQVEQVGLWSSTYRPLSAAEFRCPAVVMHRQTGLRDEQAAGSLHGCGGPVGELHYIENTHPVSSGDVVVMADPQGRFEQPLILGTVQSATVQPNSPFWKIEVAFPEVETDARTVHVIVERLNPTRLTSAVKTPDKSGRQTAAGVSAGARQ